MAAARLGLQQGAEAALDAVLLIDPNYGDHIVADLTLRNLHPDLIRVVADELRKAGLPGSETTSPAIARPALHAV